VYVTVFKDIDSDNNYHPERQLELAAASVYDVANPVDS